MMFHTSHFPKLYFNFNFKVAVSIEEIKTAHVSDTAPLHLATPVPLSKHPTL